MLVNAAGRMPSLLVANPSLPLRRTILCRKKQQHPFVEIDGNHRRLHPHSRTRLKASNKRQSNHNYQNPQDAFCSIPVEDLDQQGVFAVRDVLITEKPIYEFPQESSKRTPGRKKQQESIQHPPIHKRKEKTNEDAKESAITDWSNFLDLLLPSLCFVDEETSNSKTASANNAAIKPKTLPEANSCESIGPSTFNHQNQLRCNRAHRFLDERRRCRRRQPPLSPREEGSSPACTVVYPIAKYPSPLNNRHLVEQRRLSLRAHLTFRPVPDAE